LLENVSVRITWDTPTDKKATMVQTQEKCVFCGVESASEELIGELVSSSESCNLVVVSYCCEELVAEAGDSSGTQRKRVIRS
jgi:hypothetical protein